MQSASDCIPQSFSGKQCNQYDRNDRTYRQYDCGPQQVQRIAQKVIDQQF